MMRRSPRLDAERRRHRRMEMNCPLCYRNGAMPSRRVGNCVNLSASGILFEAPDPLAVGDEVRVEVLPRLRLSPPLAALVKVLRVEAMAGGRGYRVAATIENLLN